MIIKLINKFKKPLDLFFVIFIIPSSIVMYLFRKFGHKLKYSKKILYLIGVFPIRNHYYEPFFLFKNKKDLNKKRNLPGLNFYPKRQLNNLKKLKYVNEIKSLNLKKNSPNYNFNIYNSYFNSADAEIYYQLIRYHKPQKIIEVGSGHSTLIALEAIKKNNSQKKKVELICVEPYENKWLEKLNIKIIRKNVENLNNSFFKKLKKNDILFIDSSHMIKPYGDILKIYQEIIPTLKKGVLIHIHDIFTPNNYPLNWLIEQNKFWNEQYLVETMLMNEKKYEILLMLNYLKNNHYKYLKNRCIHLKNNEEPSSLYIRKK